VRKTLDALTPPAHHRRGGWCVPGRGIGVVSRDSTDDGHAALSAASSHGGADRLAPLYGRVLTLRNAGLSDEAIAVTLGVTYEAVPALIEVATRKQAKRDSTAERSGHERQAK
jgi:hypothetical protein